MLLVVPEIHVSYLPPPPPWFYNMCSRAALIRSALGSSQMCGRRALRLTLMAALVQPRLACSGNGKTCCEAQGYDHTTCVAVGCCIYERSHCWSAVETGACSSGTSIGGRSLGDTLTAEGDVNAGQPPSLPPSSSSSNGAPVVLTGAAVSGGLVLILGIFLVLMPMRRRSPNPRGAGARLTEEGGQVASQPDNEEPSGLRPSQLA